MEIMDNTIFLIESEVYSTKLLSYYLEFNNDCKTYKFFCTDEILNYLKMTPKIIILSESDSISIENLGKKIVDLGYDKMKLLNINGSYIELIGIDPDTNKPRIEESMIASNIYMSIVDIFKGMMNNSTVLN